MSSLNNVPFMQSPSGIDVYFDPKSQYTATIYYNPKKIEVGVNFCALSPGEQEFILFHEEGHLTYGPIPDNGIFEDALDIESKCDFYALERSNLDAAIGAMDKMIANSIRLNYTTELLDERKKKLLNHPL